MSEHTLHYGDISWTMPVADKNLAAVLESNPVSLPVMEPDQAVREALRHPIGSPCLKDIVSRCDPFVAVPRGLRPCDGGRAQCLRHPRQ